jgi:hypothetical protein
MFNEPEVQLTTAKFAAYLRQQSKHQGAIELIGRPKGHKQSLKA